MSGYVSVVTTEGGSVLLKRHKTAPPPTKNYLTQNVSIHIKKPVVHLFHPLGTLQCIGTHIRFPVNFILLIEVNVTNFL